MRHEILIVDDEPRICSLLTDLLSDAYHCVTTGSGYEAVEILRERSPAVMLCDIRMPGMSGIDLIRRVQTISPDTVILMVSGDGTFDNAVKAMRDGAFDFVTKPFNLDQLEASVKRAIRRHEVLIAGPTSGTRRDGWPREKATEWRHLRHHDPLTDLPNRAGIDEILTNALLDSNLGTAAVMMISPDRFRSLRDALGHRTRDGLLREFGRRLGEALPENAIAGRFDGDEFVVIFPNINDPRELKRILDRIGQSLRPPFAVDGHEAFIVFRSGISICPHDGTDAQVLLRNAGAALSHARQRGAPFMFFDPRSQGGAVRRFNIENDLRRALERGELELYYQPKIQNVSGRTVGIEALMRWHHVSGDISPVEFVPVAEETGTVAELGEWALRQACEQTRGWNDAGHDVSVAVNISPVQIAPEFIATVRGAIADAGLDPEKLNLEVTESSVMRDSVSAAAILKEFREDGIRVSIDDFGTGHSSFGELMRLPIDELKIDRSFIGDLTSPSEDSRLVTGMINLAHDLKLKVVAEGVEKRSQLQFLDDCGCDQWQGFLATPPVPPAGIERYFVH